MIKIIRNIAIFTAILLILISMQPKEGDIIKNEEGIFVIQNGEYISIENQTFHKNKR